MSFTKLRAHNATQPHFNIPRNFFAARASLKSNPEWFYKFKPPAQSKPETLDFRSFTLLLKSGFHTTSELRARAKKQHSYSSLFKHKHSDGLTGSERRRKLIKQTKTTRFVAKPISKNTRGFVPTRFRLTSIPSDKTAEPSKRPKLTYGVLSSRKKFKEREKVRLSKGKFKKVGSAEAAAVTKFDMVDLETLDNLKRRVTDTRFDNLNLRPELLEAVYKLFPAIPREDLRPTEIQALAIPELIKKNKPHILCAAETGTGKTLAYLIPTINNLKEQENSIEKHPDPKALQLNSKLNEDSETEAQDPNLYVAANSIELSKPEMDKLHDFFKPDELRLISTTPFRKLNRPRALVLVPSCALADQVYAVAKVLSHTAKFRAVALTSKTVRKDFLRRLSLPIDLLVSTPASVLRYLREGILSISELQFLTIDEADTMFEKGFGDKVADLINSLQNCNENQKRDYQIIVVSATLPKLVLHNLESKFPDLLRITTPSLHKALPKCKQHFVDLKDYKGNRGLGLLDVLRQFEQRNNASPKKKESDRILIFCNTRKAVSIVRSYLCERRINCLSLSGGNDYKHQPHASSEEIHHFLYPSSKRVSANYDFALPTRTPKPSKSIPEEKPDQGEAENVISATDGLDPEIKVSTTEGSKSKPKESPKILVCTDIASRGLDTNSVNHVIMYDFPTSAINFLHRCGRTARAGQSGFVTCLVGRKDRALAERIRRSIRTNTVLS
ncbi:hypothetical protein L0F63_007258 [Massospora cicadina]|nr:hypothetical protein L0F63_007258 [Massospora cicadina]